MLSTSYPRLPDGSFHTTQGMYFNTEALGSRYFIFVLYIYLDCLSSSEISFRVYSLPEGRGLLCFFYKYELYTRNKKS